MQDSYFTGIDVPKKKPDICVMSKSKALKEEQASNHPPSIATVMAGIKEELSMSDDSLIICAEHTGRYTYPLICACKSAGCRPWRENPSQIKYCPGVTRGKADRVDARRKTCFERKVAEGKERMTVSNAVRAKLVARMFAVIRNNRVYQPTLSV